MIILELPYDEPVGVMAERIVYLSRERSGNTLVHLDNGETLEVSQSIKTIQAMINTLKREV